MGILLFAGTPPTAPSGITLTPILANAVFQRGIGSTSGPVRMAGTYVDGTLTGIEAQVLRAGDDVVIKDWTALGNVVIVGGTWSGVLSDVPQGATPGVQYYAKVRAANATGVVATGATNWAMGAVFLAYGQSNTGTFFGYLSGTTPAPTTGTYVYDCESTTITWKTPGSNNAGNGAITFMNGMAALLGCPIGFVACGQPGANIDGLSDMSVPNAGFNRLVDGNGVSGGLVGGQVVDCEMWLWIHGEANANGTSKNYYYYHLGLIQSQLCARFGRTTAQFPGMECSLATLLDAAATDRDWSLMRSIQFYAGTGGLANITYSNSIVDATMQDTIHLDGEGQELNGARFVRTATYLYGSGGAPAHFELSGGTTVNATTTTLTVTHTGGATDITPSASITGFEVSGDNGATWVAPSAAVRTNATTVTLTHASMSTTNARRVRYQYGRAPNTSNPLRDNSALALLANYTLAQDLVPTPLSVVPVPTWQIWGSQLPSGTNSGASQEIYTYIVDLDLPIPGALIVLTATGTAGNSGGLPTVTITPDVGTPVVATNVVSPARTSGANGTAIYQAQLLSDANTARRLTIKLVHPSNPFGGSQIGLWTITGLSSTTPTGSSHNAASSGSSVATTLNVSANGVVIAAGSSAVGTGGNVGVIAASSSAATRNGVASPINASMGDACLLAADAASSVSITFPSAGATRISAVAYR